MSFEIRDLQIKTEIRATQEGENKFINGVIPYDSESEDMGFIEVIKKGAFSKSIKESDIRALWNHEDRLVLGRTSNGTLTFEDKKDGLHFKMRVPMNRSYAQDVLDVVQTGDADGVSFRFRVIKDNMITKGDKTFRELLEVQLIEVSVGVTFPAYPQSKAQSRAFEEVTGINLRQLITALSKDELNDEDRNFLESIDTKIRTILGEKVDTEPIDNHSESEKEPADVTLQKMQLDLLIRSF